MMKYEIKFTHSENNIFAESDTCYAVSDDVVVKVHKCKMMGRIIRIVDQLVDCEGIILNKATTNDINLAKKVSHKSNQAKEKIKALVHSHHLQMKVIEVNYTLDYKRLYISFTAEHRIDFRNLLKELASTFKTRIELRQIGSRDVAKTFGGIGPCGRPLCCSEFLGEFPSVSIKMAKNQALSLNQNKLNGLCGRLMCCLTYEDEFYRQARKNFPDVGDVVKTTDGKARVIGLNILANTIKIKVDNSIRDYDVSEIEEV